MLIVQSAFGNVSIIHACRVQRFNLYEMTNDLENNLIFLLIKKLQTKLCYV